jgi:hypothetical protein
MIDVAEGRNAMAQFLSVWMPLCRSWPEAGLQRSVTAGVADQRAEAG